VNREESEHNKVDGMKKGAWPVLVAVWHSVVRITCTKLKGHWR